MTLTAPSTSSNKYKLNRPYNKEGESTQYMKIFLFVYKSEGKTKQQIMEHLGVDPKTVIVRGFLSHSFSLFQKNKILAYNKSTRQWTAGELAEQFYKDAMKIKKTMVSK